MTIEQAYAATLADRKAAGLRYRFVNGILDWGLADERPSRTEPGRSVFETWDWLPSEED